MNPSRLLRFRSVTPDLWILGGLIFLTPLTSNLPRGFPVPFLRLNEIILLLSVGLLLARTRYRGPVARKSLWRLSWLDPIFGLLFLTGTLLPFLGYLLAPGPVNLSGLARLFDLVQFYLLYRILMALADDRDQLLLCVMALLASAILIASIGILEALNVPPVRYLIQTYYPSWNLSQNILRGYPRVVSLLSAPQPYAAFLTISLFLSLTLILYAPQQTPRRFVGLALLICFLGLLPSGAYSALIGSVFMFLVLLIIHGRLPSWIWLVGCVALVVGALVFAPLIVARLHLQFSQPGEWVPYTLRERMYHWTLALALLAPSDWLLGYRGVLPDFLFSFESQYIYLLFRGGVLFLAAHFYFVVRAVSQSYRLCRRSDSIMRAVALSTFIVLLGLTLMGLTDSYFTNSGVSEAIWTLVSLTAVGSFALNHTNIAHQSGAPSLEKKPRFILPRALPVRFSALLRATSLLALGDILAKLLAFVFFVLLARYISPAEFGIYRYSLTLGYLGSVPAAAFGLTLIHSLARRDSTTDTRLVAATLTLSLLSSGLTMFLALAAASNGVTVLIGTAIVILGLSFSYTYLAVNKGIRAFGIAAAYPVLSNIVQLLPVLAGAVWFPRAVLPIALASYGASYFVALLPLESLKRVRVPLPLRGWSRTELRAALRFSTPLFVSLGAYQAIFGLDLIWLNLFSPGAIVGYYAAAKLLATVYTVIPNALYSVLMPATAAQRAMPDAQRNLRQALILAVVTNGGLILFFALTARFLLDAVFGSGYEQAAPALLVIGLGMLFYALCYVLSAHATGSGAPQVQGIAMTIGLLTAAALGPFLTLQFSMLGASAGFTLSTLSALLVASVWSWRHLRSEATQPSTAENAKLIP